MSIETLENYRDLFALQLAMHARWNFHVWKFHKLTGRPKAAAPLTVITAWSPPWSPTVWSWFQCNRPHSRWSPRWSPWVGPLLNRDGQPRRPQRTLESGALHPQFWRVRTTTDAYFTVIESGCELTGVGGWTPCTILNPSPGVLHPQPPGSRLSPWSQFLATSIVFAIKMHKKSCIFTWKFKKSAQTPPQWAPHPLLSSANSHSEQNPWWPLLGEVSETKRRHGKGVRQHDKNDDKKKNGNDDSSDW